MFDIVYLFNPDIEDDDGGVEDDTKGSNTDEIDCAHTVDLRKVIYKWTTFVVIVPLSNTEQDVYNINNIN